MRHSVHLLLAILSLSPAVEIARRCLEGQKARQFAVPTAPELRRLKRRSRKAHRTGGPRAKRKLQRKSAAVAKPLHALRAP